MPNYEVECVHRETGESARLIYDAADQRTAMRYANDDGYVIGAVRLQEQGPAPLKPISTFRPTFRKHLTPKIARASASAALALAIIAPLLLTGSVFLRASDITDPVVWIEAIGVLLGSGIFFGLFALYSRLLAEIASILFDIYRLVREINSTEHR